MEPDKALISPHRANQYELDYRGGSIVFVRANIAGDPTLTYGDRDFYGEQIRVQDSALGELVTVTLEQRPKGDAWRLTLSLPPTWVLGHEQAGIEALVIESVALGTTSGPPPGQEIEYERVATVKGRASFLVS